MDENQIERIVKDAQTGQLNRYEQIIDHFQNPLYRYCYHLLGHHQEAEDAVQDIFIKAYEKIRQYGQKGPFSAWLYKIAFFSALIFTNPYGD